MYGFLVVVFSPCLMSELCCEEMVVGGGGGWPTSVCANGVIVGSKEGIRLE